jgi:pyridoxamine 5'-phosphate oxidase
MSIPETADPVELFQAWFAEATAHQAITEPSAMTLATATADGYPSARIVLLKAYDGRGFSFYTNLTSRKAQELEENPRAALCFFWMPLDRQIRVEGLVERVSDAEADAYFASRPRESQVGAWASLQSQGYGERLELEERLVRHTAQFAGGEVPRPEFWSGFRVVPQRIEFWLKQPFRLHDRLVYTRGGSGWTTGRLFP